MATKRCSPFMLKSRFSGTCDDSRFWNLLVLKPTFVRIVQRRCHASIESRCEEISISRAFRSPSTDENLFRLHKFCKSRRRAHIAHRSLARSLQTLKRPLHMRTATSRWAAVVRDLGRRQSSLSSSAKCRVVTCTACGHRMAHRKWRETKQEPGTAGPGNMLGCCLVSLHFLGYILCSRSAVQKSH